LTLVGPTKRDVHTQVSVPGFYDGEVKIVSAESSNELIGVRLRTILNAKIIDDKTECNVKCFMLEKTWSVRSGHW
jgi:hypothetical protein